MPPHHSVIYDVDQRLTHRHVVATVRDGASEIFERGVGIAKTGGPLQLAPPACRKGLVDVNDALGCANGLSRNCFILSNQSHKSND